MELQALIELLKAMAQDTPLLVQADSQYVVNIFTKWLPGWRAKGMRTGGGKPVENVDLINQAAGLLKDRDVRFEWVRAHNGHVLNEKADSMALSAARRAARKGS